MYCKHCGKTLDSDARFCSNCGTKVEQEAEVGFVPSFRKAEEKITAEPVQEKPKRSFHIEEFNWDLEGYPTDNKKTEEINFDWASVVEEKQRKVYEPIVSKNIEEAEPEIEEPKEERSLEEEIFADMGSLNTDEPTRVITKSERGRADKVDKFYTFNKKNEELQALLEQEYERIKNTPHYVLDEEEETPELEIPAVIEEPAEEPAEEFEIPEIDIVSEEEEVVSEAEQEEAPEEAPEVLVAEEPEVVAEIQEEPKITVEHPEYICTFWSQPPAGVIAPEEDHVPEAQEEEQTEVEPVEETESAEEDRFEPAVQTEEAASNGDETETEEPGECPPAKEQPETKLAFGDIFADDDDDVDEEPKKKGKGLKILAIFLCILVVIELCIIGIQYFAPESEAGQFINRSYQKVISLFNDNDSDVNLQAEAETEDPDIAALIEKHIDENENIGTVEEDQSLVFEDGQDYGFDDFSDSYAFDNKAWYTGDDGNSVTYGDEIITTLIQYYSSWVDYINNDENQVLEYIDNTSDFYTEIEALTAEVDVDYGINRLAVGEIRASGSGFYILTSVTVVTDDESQDTTTKQIVYMEPDQKTMKIVDVEEQ